jgi:hypothetical protein
MIKVRKRCHLHHIKKAWITTQTEIDKPHPVHKNWDDELPQLIMDGGK